MRKGRAQARGSGAGCAHRGENTNDPLRLRWHCLLPVPATVALTRTRGDNKQVMPGVPGSCHPRGRPDGFRPAWPRLLRARGGVKEWMEDLSASQMGKSYSKPSTPAPVLSSCCSGGDEPARIKPRRSPHLRTPSTVEDAAWAAGTRAAIRFTFTNQQCPCQNFLAVSQGSGL